MPELERQPAAKKHDRVVYTAKTHTVGGRENGVARSSDGRLQVNLSVPGTDRVGTNPEQLFAAGWSACLESAIGIVVRRRKLAVPNLAIDAEVDLRLVDRDYYLSARFNISLPDLDRDVAQSVVDEAENLCPYTKATKGNIDVVFNLV